MNIPAIVLIGLGVIGITAILDHMQESWRKFMAWAILVSAIALTMTRVLIRLGLADQVVVSDSSSILNPILTTIQLSGLPILLYHWLWKSAEEYNKRSGKDT